MTFIKLNNENFVNTKIVNSFNVKYKKSDNTTFLYDNNLDSKSIIFNQKDTHGTFENAILGLQEDNALNNKISSFFNFASNRIEYKINSELEIREKKNQYFEVKKDLLDNNGVTNNNLKKYNFKNSFSINRTVNTFLPCSYELYKFETIKSSLYDYYKNDFSKDFYPELDYGFCNYNTINFFSQKYNNNKVHSNCIVYSNQKDVNNINDVDFSENFSVNLWINIRKNNNTNRGCIMHIPDVFSLYSIEESEGFRICLSTGSSAKKTLNQQNFQTINFSNNSSQNEDDIGLTSSNNFLYNNWYNLNINFVNTTQNKYIVTVYKNSEVLETFNLNIVKEKLDNFDSFICLGNKPYYFKDSSSSYNIEYEDSFYSFFGKNYLLNDNTEFDGPFYKKDLNLGSNTNYNDTKFIENIITNDNMIYFNDSIEENSSFHGEIHDIKIYSNSIDKQKIESLYKKSVKDLSDEINNNSLAFFVPVFYLPIDVKKVGLFNCSKSNINLYYNSIYNPFLANSSMGLDSSVENYLVEFVKSKKPNVVISGFDNKNIFGNYYESLHSQFIDNQNDFSKIKKGISSESIFLENIDNVSLDNPIKYNNISYRNYLLLPNDNGIPEIRFDPINYFLENDVVYSKEIDFFKIDDQEKLYHIDSYNTLKYVKFQDNDRISLNRESNPGNEISLDISGQTTKMFSTKDMFFDISNYFYHDTSINSANDIVVSDNIDSYISKRLDSFNKVYIDTASNPINKNYNSDILVFRSNNSILNEDLNYRFLPLPYYTLNKSDLSLFSIIIDISTQYYNKKIKKGTLKLKDNNLLGTNGMAINISDNKKGFLFRDDCLTKSADWNYIGHVFYKDGICLIHNTSLRAFGKKDFELDFIAEGSIFIQETNIPIRQGKLNVSNNATYNKDLRLDESAFNSDEPFVYITDVNIHDENMNIVAKAKMAHPIPKKNTDNLLIRLKMDY
jgi:hypothetical protein